MEEGHGAELGMGGFKVTVDLKWVLSVFQNKTVVNLLFAAYSGDVSALRRYFCDQINIIKYSWLEIS